MHALQLCYMQYKDPGKVGFSNLYTCLFFEPLYFHCFACFELALLALLASLALLALFALLALLVDGLESYEEHLSDLWESLGMSLSELRLIRIIHMHL